MSRRQRRATPQAAALIDGVAREGARAPVVSPIDGTTVGQVVGGGRGDRRSSALAAAAQGFRGLGGAAGRGARRGARARRRSLSRQNRDALLALLQHEGGKTLDDALAEVREAVDFCRYYAAQARRALVPEAHARARPARPTTLHHRGRGVFVCISPWNFPLAIFTGQIAAALVGRQFRRRQARRADAADRGRRRCA